MKQGDVLKLGDGVHRADDRLYLSVKGNSRSWIFRGMVNGKRFMRGLGSAYDLTLAQAKFKRDEIRAELLKGNTDTKKPKESKQKKFSEIYLEAITARKNASQWKNEAQFTQWVRTVEKFALPILGDKEVAQITREDILFVLRPLWETMARTGSFVRMYLDSIFAYCIRCGYCSENPAVWQGNLAFDLANPFKAQPVKHHTAPTITDLQKVVQNGKYRHSVLIFGILTATRTNEFCRARWEDIDLEKGIWSIPPENRKDRKPEPFRVPLSTQAVKLLRSMTPRDEGWVFLFESGTHPCRQTPRVQLKNILGKSVTAHGCRSAFRDWCAETKQDFAASEKCLMHSVGGAVYQAYQRSDLLEERRKIMQMWADILYQREN